jgi:hypothetical protein
MARNSHWAQALVAVLVLWLAAALPASSCVIYETLLQSGKPDLRRYGIEPLEIVYEAAMWKHGAPLDSYPDRALVLEAAARAHRQQRILVLDIERWPVEAGIEDDLVTERIDRLRTIVGWVREDYPKLQLSYFGLMPSAAVSWALAPADSAVGIAWRRANARLEPLAASVDLILPSLYTYDADQDRWTRAAIANIEQARRYGKPVFAFIWYKYSERNEDLSYQYVGDEFWRRQLETVCNYADGVVLWGGWAPHNKQPQRWDEDESWWAVTRRFIEDRSALARTERRSR